MSKTPQTEAQRIADGLLAETSKFGTPSIQRGLLNGAIQELRRLDAALDAELANRDALDKMLTQCIAERDQLRAQLAKAVAEPAVNQQLTTEPVDEQEAFANDTKDALMAGRAYAQEALIRFDDAYDRHPSTEPERNAILTDIQLIDAAMAKGVKG